MRAEDGRDGAKEEDADGGEDEQEGGRQYDATNSHQSVLGDCDGDEMYGGTMTMG